MTASTRPPWIAKLSAVASSGVVLAAMVYLAVTGLSIVAGAVAPGLWGYVGAAGLFTVMASIPFLVINIRVFGRTAGRVLVAGVATVMFAQIADTNHWSGWVGAVWLGALLMAYLVLRTILSMPVRLTRRRAVRLLRRHRSVGNENAWTMADWEWAYTHIGTKIALEQAAWCRMLRTRAE